MTIGGPNAHPYGGLASLTGGDGQAAAMLVHDIRGALSGVTGSVCQLELMNLPEEATEQIRRMRSAAETLTMLVEHAVDPDGSLSGADNSGEVDLPSLIAHMEGRIRGEAASKGLKFKVFQGTGLPGGLRLSRVEFGRMIDNLLLNAVHHTQSGSVEVRVDRARDGGLDISISDTGSGVPAEVTRRLSDRTEKSGASPDGEHGLGLLIVRDIADRTRCGFTLEQGPSTGTVARLKVPADLCTERQDAEQETGPSITPSVLHDLSGVRILLAEDNPTNQMVANQMLGAMKATVKVVSDGVEALEEFEKNDYDLIVVDIEMPRLSGLDVIRTIRARSDAKARLPIVALTAYAMREHRDRIGKAGADGLISKPITSIADLGRSLSAFVNVREARDGTHLNTTENSVVRDGSDVDPVIDLEIFSELRETIGTEMLAELLEKVITDLETSRKELIGSIATSNRTQIRSSSHILISVGGAIGAKRLQYSAKRLNTEAHQPEIRDLDVLVNECVAEVGTAMEFVLGQQREGGYG